MTPKKTRYTDEDELIDEYCEKQGCTACNGTDVNGEANGYGCPQMQEWVEKHSYLINSGSMQCRYMD